MTNFNQFLSHAGESMQESAIRQMGAMLAGAPDMVSFAPGYPDDALFPWEERHCQTCHLCCGKCVLRDRAGAAVHPPVVFVTIA